MPAFVRNVTGSDAGTHAILMRKIWEALNEAVNASGGNLMLDLSSQAIGSGSATDPQFDGGTEDNVVIKVGFKARVSGHNDFWALIGMKSPVADFMYPVIKFGTGPGASGSDTLDNQVSALWPDTVGNTSGRMDYFTIVASDRGFLIYGKDGNDVRTLVSVDRGRYFNGNEADKLVFSYFQSTYGGTYTQFKDPDGAASGSWWARSFSVSGLSSRKHSLVFAEARHTSSSPYYNVVKATSMPTFNAGASKLVYGPYPAPDEIYTPHSTWFLTPEEISGVMNVFLSPTETAQFNFEPLIGSSTGIRIAIRVS